jgi:hypothetical protein
VRKVSTLIISSSLIASFAVAQEKTTWTGNANINLNIAQSQQDSQSFFLFGTASQAFKSGTKLDIGFLYLYGRQTSGAPKEFGITEDRWALTGHYDFPSNGVRFGFLDQRFERNGVVNLGLRSVTTAGFGQYVLRTANVVKNGKVSEAGDASWKLSAGISNLNEQYTNGSPNVNNVGLNIGSRYERVLSGGTTITHDFQIIPAFNDFGNYYYVSLLNVAFPVRGNATLNLSLLNDFDSSPAAGARKDNAKLGLTLGYKF